jgi:hypothetical protein
MLDNLAATLARLREVVNGSNSFNPSNVPAGFSVFDDGPDGYQGFGSGTTNLGQNNYGGLAGAGIYGGGGAAVINYTINASGIGDQQIASVVQNAIQDLNRYGSSTTFAGAL